MRNTESVMLSPSATLTVNSAKHLLVPIENKQKQILRCAYNDIAPSFFRRLFSPVSNSSSRGIDEFVS
ncbi:MAG: hypothetical protein ACRD5K_18660 [Candidatus Acidiferrales bacterium]